MTFGLNKNSEDLKLSAAELTALQYTAQGLTNTKIAEKTGQTLNQVKNNMSQVRKKLQAKNARHAVAKAFRLGFLE